MKAFGLAGVSLMTPEAAKLLVPKKQVVVAQQLPNSVTFTIGNLPKDCMVGVFDEETMDAYFLGKASGVQEVKVPEGAKLLVRARKSEPGGYRMMPFEQRGLEAMSAEDAIKRANKLSIVNVEDAIAL